MQQAITPHATLGALDGGGREDQLAAMNTHELPHAEAAKRDTWQAVRRGLSLRCPSCGRGKLLSGYLKPAEGCSECGERTGDIRADDAPAWATILLVGHLISPVFFLFATPDASATWAPFLLIVALVIGLTLLLLPRMKGLFVGLIWANRAGEGEPG